MADFDCRVEIPPQSGLPENELSVGRVFDYVCAGPWPEFRDPLKLAFELGEKEKHSLKLLGLSKEPDGSLRLKVTSYRTGQVQIENLKLVDGDQKIELGPVKFQVASVLEPSETPPEPYGPMGPFSVSIPLVYWAVLLTSLVLLLSWAGFRWRRHLQKKRLLEKMREHDSALPPLTDFHQKLRRLARAHAFFDGAATTDASEVKTALLVVERLFRIFLLREYRLPALDWADRLLLSELRRSQRELMRQEGAELKRLLKEFASARATTRLEAKDVVQLALSSRRWAERAEKMKRGARK